MSRTISECCGKNKMEDSCGTSQAREKRGRKPAPINKSYDYSFVKTCKVLNISTEVFGRALKLYKSQKQGNVKLFDLMQKYKLHLEDKDLEDRVGFVRRVFDY